MCDEFIHREIISLTLRAGLTRGNQIYTENPSEKRKRDMKESIDQKLREYKNFINDGFHADPDYQISEDYHVNKIIEMSDEINRHFYDILHADRLFIGRSQKIVNLYLKYCWRLEWIPVSPLHCPFDSIVLKEGLGSNDAWTSCDDIGTYLEWVGRAETQSGNESIAQWEYSNYPKWANQDSY